ncbi:M48 family metallopeptidase [Candidatus Accumulibacter sp. ACC003]|uniref:M48 family metallopeptidase n=1 Tax=Candidatus Accumulibacter sp. ACC003 TaxID=2823334 RepID=UPI0025B9F2FF|nr:M48 family metallopeptidase [Candidatus Accumulibacter sp. ACC003]
MRFCFFQRGVLALLAAVLVTACAATRTTGGGTVGVDRDQTMLLSSTEVDRSAAKAYQQTMREAQSKKLLNRDPAQLARVRGVARRLIPVTAAFRSDAPGWQWEVNVVSSKELNAWCMPGGKVAVYTGLLEQLEITDDELAAVMGHEIAHALREHGREKAGQAAGLNVAAALGGALIGAYFGIDSGLGQGVIGSVGDLAFMRPNSREMEQEADRIGIELAARAGYDPQATISLWEKMSRVGGGQPPQWLSTHPSHQSRIADLRVYAQRVQPLYVAARRSP